jgi:hypothetical protein
MKNKITMEMLIDEALKIGDAEVDVGCDET